MDYVPIIYLRCVLQVSSNSNKYNHDKYGDTNCNRMSNNCYPTSTNQCTLHEKKSARGREKESTKNININCNHYANVHVHTYLKWFLLFWFLLLLFFLLFLPLLLHWVHLYVILFIITTSRSKQILVLQETVNQCWTIYTYKCNEIAIASDTQGWGNK